MIMRDSEIKTLFAKADEQVHVDEIRKQKTYYAMIEEMENFVRSNLDTLYMSKNQETVDTIRILHPSDLPKRSLLAELSGKLKPRME